MQASYHPAYAEERKKLQETNIYIETKLNELETKIRKASRSIEEEQIRIANQMFYHSLIDNQERPYYGRIDLFDQRLKKKETYYIGKVGIPKDEDTTLLVIDWRTPIAKIFHQYSGAEEEMTYRGEEGEIKIKVLLKRRIDIVKKELKEISDTVSAKGKRAEELLYHDPYLIQILQRERKTGDLPVIVETIQKEQDQVIRAPFDRPLVIQGAAGSGKSSIALHRLSYLIFNHKTIKPERLIIFAPHQLFLSYIDKSITDLELKGMKGTTFLDWAKERLGQIQVIPLHQRVEEVLVGKEEYIKIREIGKFKGSLQCKEGIERYIHFIMEQIVKMEDFEINPTTHLPYYKIRKLFYEEYKAYPLNKRIEKTLQSIETFATDYLNEQLKRLDEQYEAEYSQWVAHLPKGSRRRQEADEYTKNHFNKRREALADEVNRALSETKKKWVRLNPVTLFRDLFSNRERLLDLYRDLSEEMADKIVERLQHLKDNKAVDYEDLAIILHLDMHINGIGSYFNHIVIDEAQDYSPYQMEMIKSLTRDANSLTILGDLAQGIYDYNGIEEWSDIQGVFPNMEYRQISFNYRSTYEIIEQSNQVLKSIGKENIPIPVHIGRRGREPKWVYVEEEKNLGFEIRKAVSQILSTTRYSLAVITRNDEEAKRFFTEFQGQGLKINLLNEMKPGEKSRAVILPITLAKGLEYDAVILADINREHDPEHSFYAKLFYVAITRALHNVTIFYTKQPPPYFKGMIEPEMPMPQTPFEWLDILRWGRKYQHFTPEEDKAADQYAKLLTMKTESPIGVNDSLKKVWEKVIRLGYKSAERKGEGR